MLFSFQYFFSELVQNPTEGIVAGPKDEENFFEWHCLIAGPEGTCFEHGLFPAKLSFSEVFFLNFLVKNSRTIR
jgi:ubiquitin-protein ligase